MNGPLTLLLVALIAVLLVVAHMAHEKNRDARVFDGVDEWEAFKAAARPVPDARPSAPRVVP